MPRHAILPAVAGASRRLLCLTLASLLPAVAQAQSSRLRLETGNANLFSVTSLQQCETSVIAGSHGSLLLSTDDGQRWGNAGLNLGATLYTVAASAHPPRYIAAGTRGSIAISEDCGRHWSSGSIHESADLRALITAGSDASVLLAGGEKGLLMRSDDGGQRWEELRLGSGYIAHLLRSSAGVLLAGGEQGLLARSQDEGQRWTPLSGLDKASLTRLQEVLPGLVIASFADGRILYTDARALRWKRSRMPASTKPPVINAFAASRSGVLLATTADGRLLRSADRARSWQILAGMPGRFLSSVISTGDDEFIVAGAQGTLARSRERGTAWMEASVPTRQEFETLKRLPTGALVAAGSGGVIARSGDDGLSWQLVREGVNAYTHMLATDGSLLIAAGTQGSLARSEDGGRNWFPVREPDDRYFFSVAYEPVSQSFLAAGTQGMLLRSTDRGLRWEEKKLGGDGSLGPLLVLPGGKLLALSTDHGILVSENGGADWSASDASADIIWQSAAHDGSAQQIVAIGRDSLPVFSTDGGRHWQATASQDARGANRIRYLAGVFLAAGKEGEILRSEDGGQHFERVFLPVFSEPRDFEAIPGLPHGIVAVGSKGSILRSLDAGKSWEAASSGSQELLRTVVRAPGRDTLFAAGRSGPILRSEDGGQRWQAATDTLDARINGSLGTADAILFWGDRIFRLSE
ncbi:WD40/YVTN/BNR-like repeat-containing protein [Uliginosibacterium paludis]|uniref:Photosynthesis system II assembly factor Ycf48/Hcf136-like domain-containing protein n=1 Tax=Uliginosibacterium paludis TaxID=1615952 RepID=A0ABV2CKA1_9RHOO